MALRPDVLKAINEGTRIEGRDPIEYAITNNIVIDAHVPTFEHNKSYIIKYALKNKLEINGVDPMLYAIDQKLYIYDKKFMNLGIGGETQDRDIAPLEYAIANNIPVDGKDPVQWGIDNNHTHIMFDVASGKKLTQLYAAREMIEKYLNAAEGQEQEKFVAKYQKIIQMNGGLQENTEQIKQPYFKKIIEEYLKSSDRQKQQILEKQYNALRGFDNQDGQFLAELPLLRSLLTRPNAAKLLANNEDLLTEVQKLYRVHGNENNIDYSRCDLSLVKLAQKVNDESKAHNNYGSILETIVEIITTTYYAIISYNKPQEIDKPREIVKGIKREIESLQIDSTPRSVRIRSEEKSEKLELSTINQKSANQASTQDAKPQDLPSKIEEIGKKMTTSIATDQAIATDQGAAKEPNYTKPTIASRARSVQNPKSQNNR